VIFEAIISITFLIAVCFILGLVHHYTECILEILYWLTCMAVNLIAGNILFWEYHTISLHTVSTLIQLNGGLLDFKGRGKVNSWAALLLTFIRDKLIGRGVMFTSITGQKW